MEALISRWRAPRSLGSVVTRVLVPRIVMFGAVVGMLLVGRVMAVDPSASRIEQIPTAVPTWSAADRTDHPDCMALSLWPQGQVGSAVVVYRYQDGQTVKVPFDRAWRINHDATEANDLWVLGVCP